MDDIILKFTDADILVDDGAYNKLKRQKNPLKLTESLIDNLQTIRLY